MMNPAQIAAALPAAVPFVQTVGIEIVDVTADAAVVRLPDNTANHNHVAGPHAGAMFTAAETASGVMVLAAFSAYLTKAVPLTTRALVEYVARASGTLTATATLARPAEETAAELDGGGRPVIEVRVDVTDSDGTTVAVVTVDWVLRPQR